MTTPTLPLGIDVSKKVFDVILQYAGRESHGVFDNTPQGFAALRKWLKKRGVKRVHACLEATGRYGDELALFLHDQGHLVSVVNPAQIKAYAESKLVRNKTDKGDARLIAEFCETQNPPLWTPSDPAIRELQALVRQLDALRQMRTQELNRLQSGVPSPVVVESLKNHLAFLDEQIQHIEQSIRDLIDHHPDLKRQKDLLTSIPGIGDTTAAILLAEVGNFHDFPRASKLVAYAGLSPHQHHSGSSSRRRSRLSRLGKRSLRKALYLPALAAMRFNPIIRAFAARLKQRGKHTMTVISAAMRKLLTLAYGVLKSGLPFDPNYRSRHAMA